MLLFSFSFSLSLFSPRQTITKKTQVGLDNAGKTSILYRLHLGETVSTTPTLGCNVERVVAPTSSSASTSSPSSSSSSSSSSGLEFEVWDLGGQANLRPSWAAYYKSSDAAILVVDCTDRARVGIARGELSGLLSHDHLDGAPLLVFANKQDARDAMRPPELTAALALHGVQQRDWHVAGCCALTGEGLEDGLRWLADAVKRREGGGGGGGGGGGQRASSSGGGGGGISPAKTTQATTTTPPATVTVASEAAAAGAGAAAKA